MLGIAVRLIVIGPFQKILYVPSIETQGSD